MNQVYRHRPRMTDELLGHVNADGKVYETRLGPDQFVGRVELDTGKIFESRPGPDHYIGRVELDSGKIFLARLGPDHYLGRIDDDGNIYAHKPLARDEYLGKVVQMTSFAHAGGAFLLLVHPIHSAEAAKNEVEEKPTDLDPGAQPAGAA